MTPCDPLSINGIQEVSGSIPLISTNEKGQVSYLSFFVILVQPQPALLHKKKGDAIP